ncbi:hypothetical protein N7516_007288 [Penicillium verrucosum]|uniref:uncharacterized protein n=1 Tax=Penicillium verrucosum TaxID=60171 RepID=UPI002545B9F6|nr:uncharacterized protein N7516_007288 [Penicillium verrucosum]KAJ5932799.1 hypothetical protein N7516_007288 [Penicillium verrucosum]
MAFGIELGQAYVIKRNQNEPPILLPVSLVNATYGPDDISTIYEIEYAVRAVDKLRSRKDLSRDEISMELYNHIHNKDLFQSDIAKFIQASMLVGYKIDPKSYFKGSCALWDGESPVKLMTVAFNGEKDSHGHDLVLLKVSYKRLSLDMVTNVTQVFRIVY